MDFNAPKLKKNNFLSISLKISFQLTYLYMLFDIVFVYKQVNI